MTSIRFVKICESVREVKRGYRHGHRICVVANMNFMYKAFTECMIIGGCIKFIRVCLPEYIVNINFSMGPVKTGETRSDFVPTGVAL